MTCTRTESTTERAAISVAGRPSGGIRPEIAQERRALHRRQVAMRLATAGAVGSLLILLALGVRRGAVAFAVALLLVSCIAVCVWTWIEQERASARLRDQLERFVGGGTQGSEPADASAVGR